MSMEPKLDLQKDVGTVTSLLADCGDNCSRVVKLADDMIDDIHISLMSHLCGDISASAVWKMMYLCGFQTGTQERMTLLSLITEYVGHSDTLLFQIYTQGSKHLLMKLTCIWNSSLMKAKLDLTEESFMGMVNTLERCVQRLKLYNLHHNLSKAQNLAHQLQQTDRTKIHDIPAKKCLHCHYQFPQYAVLPFSKIQKILNKKSKKPTAEVMSSTSAIRINRSYWTQTDFLKQNVSSRSTLTAIEDIPALKPKSFSGNMLKSLFNHELPSKESAENMNVLKRKAVKSNDVAISCPGKKCKMTTLDSYFLKENRCMQ